MFVAAKVQIKTIITKNNKQSLVTDFFHCFLHNYENILIFVSTILYLIPHLMRKVKIIYALKKYMSYGRE